MTFKFACRLLAAFSVFLCLGSASLVSAATSAASLKHVAPQSAIASQSADSNSPSAPGKKLQAQTSLANIPLNFEPNRGQTSGQVQWLSRGPDFTLFLAGHDAVLEMNTITPGKTPVDQPKVTGAALRMNLLGSVSATQSEGLKPLAGRANYFRGNDPAKWQRDIPTFGRVKLPAVYPGVDLIYYGQKGHLEYDFVVAPGADPSAIRLGFEGAKPTLTASGDLLLELGGKKVTLDRPVVYQSVKGAQQPIAGSFAIASNNEVTFKLGTYDHSRELTIDPVLIFDGAIGTGNNGDSTAYGMTVDAAGEIIFTGVTRDTSFPTTPGVFQPTCGTSSINPANNPRCTSRTDAFITKLSADGASLVFSTYLSGTQYDEAGQAVAVDAAGTIYVVGNTRSDDFPITSDAFQKLCDPTYTDNTFTTLVAYCGNNTTGAISEDIFLVKINPGGSQILYGTFLGGSSQDVSTGVALDPAGNIYISGITSSSNPPGPATGVGTLFPVTTTAYQTIGAGGNFSASLSKFSNDGHSLLYSTFFGTPSTQNAQRTYGIAVAVGSNGVAFLGGFTDSVYLPTTAGTIKTACDPNSSNATYCLQDTGFVAAFDTTKSGTASLVYSTMLGPPSGATGSFSHTYVNGLLADASNDVFVTGSTLAYNFPTTSGAYQTSCAFFAPQGDCGPFAYLSKINPTGTGFLFSTFYGGPNARNDTSAGYAIATDAKGRVYLYGSKSGLCDLPVLFPIQTNCQGYPRVFVAAFAPDASQLVFGTEFGSPNGTETPVTYNGLALDPAGNIYFGGMTTNTTFPTTPGTYVVSSPGGFQRPFFGKISPILVPSVTGLAINPSVTIAGHPVTFTVSVTSTQTTPAATGTVVLTNSNTSPASTIGTITLGSNGTGTFTTSSLQAGVYSVTASYSGDTVYDPSGSAAQTLTINTPTTSTVALSISSTSVVSGGSVTLTATVTGPQGSPAPTGTVSFLDGATTLGTAMLTNGTATYTTSALMTGANSISANYSGDNVYSPASSSSQNVTVTNTAAGLQFIPVTPCRVADTRNASGAFGGPGLGAGATRTFNIPQSSCAIPSTAVAYSLNVTVVPNGVLNYLTMWPAGLTQPYVSTLNSDGRLKANAAITPAGTNGGVSIFVSDATHVILDIDGYFVPAGTASALAFYPVTPCRVSDTRSAAGPLGGPFIAANTHRDFPVQSSSCGIPANAKAYSLNVTALPHKTLSYLTAWATGQPQPNVSTLNSSTGAIAANAAIVPASSSGNVAIFVSNDADVILDVNGYFAAPATNGLSLYTATPCRVIDTRSAKGAFNGVLAVAVQSSSCAPPATAQAYVLNATVVPPGPLTYLTLWPNGQNQPYVSTLNAIDGAITSNMAIVPNVSGTTDVFSSNPTNVILDITSYFAP